MSTDPLILAFDLGTTSLKAALYDRDGRRVAGVQVPCRVDHPQPGWAEQDAESWWTAVGEASRDLLAGGTDPARIAAIGFCSQTCGTVPVSADGTALHPALIWLDTRSAPIAKRITAGFPKVSGYGLYPLLRWIWTTNGAPNLAGKDSTSKMLWLREQRPDLWAATRHVLDVKDFLLLRCTGEAVTTPDCAHLTWLMDSKTNQWSEAMLRRTGMDKALLPRIVPSTAAVGTGLTEAAARHLGLRAHIPVVAGTSDISAFSLGAGSIEDGAPHLYVGTSAWIAAHTSRRAVDPLHAIGAIRAADPARYLIIAAQETAGASLDRTSALLGLPSDDPAALHRLAAEAPPGANGLTFLPWLFGERVPVDDPHVRGGFLNLSLTHERADMARAAIEGVALNLRWAAGHLLRLARTAPDQPIRLLGGSTQSDLFCQTLADALGRPLIRMADPRWSGVLGAAMSAAVGLGWRADLAEAAKMAAEEHCFAPDPSLAGLHDRRFKALTRAFSNNQSWFRDAGR